MSARTTPGPGEREHWTKYPPETLHRMLVEDAVAAHATELTWMIGALARIAKDTRRPVEDVFSAVVAEVESLGAHMPMHSGPIGR